MELHNEHGTKIFEAQPDKQLMYAKAENQRLKSIIGDLTVELKKTKKRGVDRPMTCERSSSHIEHDKPLINRIASIKRIIRYVAIVGYGHICTIERLSTMSEMDGT